MQTDGGQMCKRHISMLIFMWEIFLSSDQCAALSPHQGTPSQLLCCWETVRVAR